MEKIININLAGRIIPIEDSAYTALKAYFDSLRRHFATEEGADEILADIESRVSELLAQKLSAGAPAINNAHIKEVTAIMGSAEDFGAEAGDAPRNQSAPGGKRRFLRDEQDKVLGGVCSGLAAYFNVDPALARIVLALLAFGSLGTGVILYLVLWAVVPAGDVTPYSGRRLYRDVEHKRLGGIAAGVAAYYQKEVWIVRLLFVAPFLLSMLSGSPLLRVNGSFLLGSLTGVVFLIYIILWIVLPAAESEFQKMEMRGERVDINSIRDNVYADIRDRARAFGDEVKNATSEFVGGRGRKFADEVQRSSGSLARRGAEVIGTLVKTVFLFIGSVVALTLFMLMIAYFFGGFSGVADRFLFATPTQRTLGWLSVLLLLGAPVLGLVTDIAQRMLRLGRGATRYFRATYFLIWLVGIGCAIALASSMSGEFARSGNVVEERATANPGGGRLIVKVPGEEVVYNNELPWLHIRNAKGFNISDNNISSTLVNVLPAPSADSLYHIIVSRTAYGRDAKAARTRAGAINYAVALQPGTDSVLNIQAFYDIYKAQLFRGQTVSVVIQVPVGKKIRFDESVKEKLHGDHDNGRIISQESSYTVGSWKIHSKERYAYWESDVDYTMGTNGELFDPAEPNNSGSYQNYSNWDDDLDAEEARDERRRDREERARDKAQGELERARNVIEREAQRRQDSIDREIDRLNR